MTFMIWLFFIIKIKIFICTSENFRSEKQKVFYQKILLPLKPITTWQERERPKRTVNIFLAGYSRRSWFYDFMGSILWSCRLDSRYAFYTCFAFYILEKKKKNFRRRAYLSLILWWFHRTSWFSWNWLASRICLAKLMYNAYFILLNNVSISTYKKIKCIQKKLLPR